MVLLNRQDRYMVLLSRHGVKVSQELFCHQHKSSLIAGGVEGEKPDILSDYPSPVENEISRICGDFCTNVLPHLCYIEPESVVIQTSFKPHFLLNWRKTQFDAVINPLTDGSLENS
jgi:hypothetical protein